MNDCTITDQQMRRKHVSTWADKDFGAPAIPVRRGVKLLAKTDEFGRLKAEETVNWEGISRKIPKFSRMGVVF